MDMTPSQMQAAIRKARAPGMTIENELAELRAIVLALDTWAGDGLRTGQELDQITTAARDYVETFGR